MKPNYNWQIAITVFIILLAVSVGAVSTFFYLQHDDAVNIVTLGPKEIQ